MPEQNPARTHRFQFSVASLLWLTLVVALAIAGMREHLQRAILDAKVSTLEAKLKDVNSKLDTAETQVEKLQLEKKIREDHAVLYIGPVRKSSETETSETKSSPRNLQP